MDEPGVLAEFELAFFLDDSASPAALFPSDCSDRGYRFQFLMRNRTAIAIDNAFRELLYRLNQLPRSRSGNAQCPSDIAPPWQTVREL